jgi:hypothetical protein
MLHRLKEFLKDIEVEHIHEMIRPGLHLTNKCIGESDYPGDGSPQNWTRE